MRAPIPISMAARSIWRDSLSTLLAGALAALGVAGVEAVETVEVGMARSCKQ